ncbi:hypothetical protein BC830DRAFT_414170 [Chytriomyces sp. MP71]|nr:hypothetical protein BC830DRAFT_414170 [Chytriomyces sp. MP71]
MMLKQDAETNQGEKSQTESASSFKGHDVGSLLTDFRHERSQYISNKSRANRGGDWFSNNGQNDGATERAPAGLDASRNARVTETSLSYGAKSVATGEAGGAAGGAASNELWFAHRRRKQQTNNASDHGKHFNILTGIEDASRFDPSQHAKRVSVEKMLARQDGNLRTYNIISNK